MSGPSVSILFLNAGRRVGLIRHVREALRELGLPGRIITTNDHGFAPALYLGDARYLLPRSREPDFLERFGEICAREHVDLVVPLIDPDLPVLAAHRERLERQGTRVLVSSGDAIEVCRDKRRTWAFLAERSYPTPAVLSLEDAATHGFPLFIKPSDGSASVDAIRIQTLEELSFFSRHIPNPIIQEFAGTEEFTVDVFSDWSAKPLLSVVRRRLQVRSGEVSVGRVERIPELEHLCQDLASALHLVGPSNIQAIRSPDGFKIVEINPRFGGGCPLSIMAGAPLAAWTIMLARGESPSAESIVLREGLTMMRYDDAIYLADDEVAR